MRSDLIDLWEEHQQLAAEYRSRVKIALPCSADTLELRSCPGATFGLDPALECAGVVMPGTVVYEAEGYARIVMRPLAKPSLS